jgi:hypothetical protein
VFCVTVSALAMQVWELVIHWSDEVEYLWKCVFNLLSHGLLFMANHEWFKEDDLILLRRYISWYGMVCCLLKCESELSLSPCRLPTPAVSSASEITSYKMQIEESTVHDCINAFIFKIIIAQLTLTMVEMILYFRGMMTFPVLYLLPSIHVFAASSIRSL